MSTHFHVVDPPCFLYMHFPQTSFTTSILTLVSSLLLCVLMGITVGFSGLVLTHILHTIALLLSLPKSFLSWVTRPCLRPTPQIIKETLQVVSYGEHQKRSSCDHETCAVCLNELRERDQVRELRNCCHVFHADCLDRWLDQGDQKNCPLCRASLLVRTDLELDLDCGVLNPSRPGWVVERLLYLFGDDLL